MVFVYGWPSILYQASCTYAPKLNRLYIIGGFGSYDDEPEQATSGVFYLDFVSTVPDPILPELITSDSVLPSTLSSSAIVYDGKDHIYLVGGMNGTQISGIQGQILKYSLLSGEVERDAFIPVYKGAAIMHGDNIIHFAGRVNTSGAHTQDVVSYSTIHKNYTVVIQLPMVYIISVTVAWDSDKQIAYIFGGSMLQEEKYVEVICSYNPLNHDIQIVAQMRDPFQHPAAFWYTPNGNAFLIGDHSSSLGEVMTYDPTQQNVTRFNANFPYKLDWPCVVYSDLDGHAYVLSSRGWNDDGLIKFNPAILRAKTMKVDGWPGELLDGSCVYVHRLGRLYIFGGYRRYNKNETRTIRDEISYIELNTYSTVLPSTETIDSTTHAGELTTYATPESETTEYRATTESMVTEDGPTTRITTDWSVTDYKPTPPDSTTEWSSSFPETGYSLPFFVYILAASASLAAFVSCVYLILRYCRGDNSSWYKNILSRMAGNEKVLASLTVYEVREFEEGIHRHHGSNETGLLSCQDVIDQQPYNRDFEIDKSEVRINHDQLLGAGQFGIVYAGTRIRTGEAVAIKSVKANSTNKLQIRALLSEIKVLIYIGNHEHIVKLIGATTTELLKGAAYIVMEFCGLGDLETYLRKHSDSFFDCFDTVNSAPGTTYMKLCDVELAQMSTCDLYRWSIQIASAMEYLGTKKVIHGDLATRNVLLFDKMCAKITDFGLAKKLYNYMNYTKGGDIALPWRNMAIESLLELKFSSLSDMWSFGVTLWEIFSLGDIPYTAGMQFSEEFVVKLKRGFRLSIAQYASANLHEEMLSCWMSAPMDRPNFAGLKCKLEKMMQQCNHHQQTAAE